MFQKIYKKRKRQPEIWKIFLENQTSRPKRTNFYYINKTRMQAKGVSLNFEESRKIMLLLTKSKWWLFRELVI